MGKICNINHDIGGVTLRKKVAVIFLILLGLLFTYELNTYYFLKKIYPLKYQNYVVYYAKEYGVDPYLVFAVIKVESNFKSNAISSKNAIGLMQILPETGEWIAKKIGIKNYSNNMLFEPKYNIQMGTWYLSYLLKNFNGNMQLAIAAYNGGSGNVDAWLKDKKFSKDGKQLHAVPFPETNRYIKKVLAVYQMYKFIYETKN
ncbi:Lytic transglycosylase, catalytic [Thermoanaerobacter pseudethanolicus ATCC 33223]|uniref:Lytic transglycosylase, catalytic n=1 Tax=Thermoanaerobacter pseudethanolicus (strain ATCC 33223 / 39E) TaxID=340099 RepID=B0KAF9_THEP3|nr:Lytic transglycosylase, catalytic [Thermoanaerobacter sp. X514]ABY95122.1 Lytic transglycosylase, catalytic [Thermoanaerobacter pseudethanolicus ATCC 33223]